MGSLTFHPWGNSNSPGRFLLQTGKYAPICKLAPWSTRSSGESFSFSFLLPIYQYVRVPHIFPLFTSLRLFVQLQILSVHNKMQFHQLYDSYELHELTRAFWFLLALLFSFDKVVTVYLCVFFGELHGEMFFSSAPGRTMESVSNDIADRQDQS